MTSESIFTDARTKVGCLMIGMLLFSGCAARTGPQTDRSHARLDKERDEIAARENKCLNDAASKLEKRFSEIAATFDAFSGFAEREAKSNFYWEVWQCQREASRENEKLDTTERAQYSRAQNQGHGNPALMGMLLSSRPH